MQWIWELMKAYFRAEGGALIVTLIIIAVIGVVIGGGFLFSCVTDALHAWRWKREQRRRRKS